MSTFAWIDASFSALCNNGVQVRSLADLITIASLSLYPPTLYPSSPPTCTQVLNYHRPLFSTSPLLYSSLDLSFTPPCIALSLLCLYGPHPARLPPNYHEFPPFTQHPAQHIHAHKPDIRPPALPRQPGLVNFLWNQKIVRTGKAVIATTNAGFKIPRLPVVPPIPGVNHNANEAGKDAHAQFGTKRSSASLLTGLKHKKDQQQHRLPTMEEPYVASAATKSVSATLRTAYTTARVDKISQSPTQLCTSTYTPVGLNETPRKDVRRHTEKDK